MYARNSFLLVSVLALFVLSLAYVVAVEPFGAGVSELSNERAPNDTAGSHEALAGNVTLLEVTAYSITQSWQGYYGNVSGTIQLADASDNVMYNWSLASPEGEIYASTNDTLGWTNVQCFNFTATGATGSEDATRGGTSVIGYNLSQLEAEYGLASDDVDGVNETFSDAGTHDEFFTANLQFSAGECVSTSIFDSTGQSVDNNFEEVILYDPDTTSIIFTAILDEEDVSGFDNENHDFEMLVLENGHGTDVATTTYYFWVELE